MTEQTNVNNADGPVGSSELLGDKTEQLAAFVAWERQNNPGSTHVAEWALREIERLRQALRYAQSGLQTAYSSAEKHFNDEVLLHCGHHEAMIAKALAPNASVQPTAKAGR